jgi:hypothetical protein
MWPIIDFEHASTQDTLGLDRQKYSRLGSAVFSAKDRTEPSSNCVALITAQLDPGILDGPLADLLHVEFESPMNLPSQTCTCVAREYISPI